MSNTLWELFTPDSIHFASWYSNLGDRVRVAHWAPIHFGSCSPWAQYTSIFIRLTLLEKHLLWENLHHRTWARCRARLVHLNLSSHLPPLDTQYSCITIWVYQLSMQVMQPDALCIRLSGWTERDGLLFPPATYLPASCAEVRPDARVSFCTLKLAFPSPLHRLQTVCPPSLPLGDILPPALLLFCLLLFQIPSGNCSCSL